MKLLPNLFTSTPPKAGQPVAPAAPAAYWSLAPEQLLSALHASKNGLQPADAEQRLKQYGLNTIGAQRKATALRLLLRQLESPPKRVVLSYVRLLRVSVRTIKPGERHWADRHDRRDLSLFRRREMAA